MGKPRRLACIIIASAVQLLLLWSCASATAQPPGFLSIYCGSSIPNYTDSLMIEWTSDADLMTEGEIVPVDGVVAPFDTMRLFTGNLSKYCYRLSNSAVKPGAFFLVRAGFSMGSTPRNRPKSSDGNYFRFKLLIDADEWCDVEYPYASTTWLYYEAYIRALHNSIDVCLARSTSGDDPFISALELRPLPSSLSAARLMNTTNLSFIDTYHDDSGGSVYTRYPADSLDRIWRQDVAPSVLSTNNVIDTTKDNDKPPVKVLQTAFLLDDGYTLWRFQDRDVNSVYSCVIYFAEIDQMVNASGQRVFNIMLNGETPLNAQPIDVFKEVGAFTSYEMAAGNISTDEQGNISFTFSATSTSLFPPMFGAMELFKASSNPFSFGSSSNDIMAIEDLKASMSLSSHTGDPCLPIGFGYSWLTCTADTTSMGVPRIISISLSNYSTGGSIPGTINTLTMLDKVLLDGNNLEGSIPNMSALTNLEILDLSNNKLSGSIPESLATLKNLKVLNLANNDLEGEIPPDLILRKEASTLDFNFSGNPLCENMSKETCTLPYLPSSKSKESIRLIVGVVIAVLFVVMIGISLTLFYLCKKKPFSNPFTQKEIPLFPSSISSSNLNPDIEGSPPMFCIQELTLEDIKVATNNFNTQIGHGGFGPVYKGILNNGDIVAIKVSSNSSHQGSKEFLNEVDLLSRIHHKNLVGLLGFCKGRELILVYEYMSKGSLFDCLHGEIAKDSPLSWSTRLKILVDSAQGLDYLHHGCYPRIIHRDIKSSNILLNDKLEAKISDFGISRSSYINETGAPTTILMGSMGYIDPEYLSKMRLTEKVDIYSFGVLLFEVICGRRAIFMDESHKETHIVEWIRPYIERGVINIIVDAALHGDYTPSSVWKVLDVALSCVQLPSDQRPNMSIVYSDLKEAQSMDLERDEYNTFNMLPTPITFTKNYFDSLPLTQVLPR